MVSIGVSTYQRLTYDLKGDRHAQMDPRTVLYCSRLGELASKRPEPRQNTTHDDFCKNVTEIVALFENATAPTCPPWGKKVIRNDQKWHFFAFFITFFPH